MCFLTFVWWAIIDHSPPCDQAWGVEGPLPFRLYACIGIWPSCFYYPNLWSYMINKKREGRIMHYLNKSLGVDPSSLAPQLVLTDLFNFIPNVGTPVEQYIWFIWCNSWYDNILFPWLKVSWAVPYIYVNLCKIHCLTNHTLRFISSLCVYSICSHCV